jgi:hypothetical protein
MAEPECRLPLIVFRLELLLRRESSKPVSRWSGTLRPRNVRVPSILSTVSGLPLDKAQDSAR